MGARQELIKGVINDRAFAFFDALDNQRKARLYNDPAALPAAIHSSTSALERLCNIVKLQQRDNRKGCLGLIANSIIRWR